MNASDWKATSFFLAGIVTVVTGQFVLAEVQHTQAYADAVKVLRLEPAVDQSASHDEAPGQSPQSATVVAAATTTSPAATTSAPAREAPTPAPEPAPEPADVVASATTAASAPAEAITPADTGASELITLIASADIARGEKVYKKCKSCHTIDEGGRKKVGPNLWGIVGDRVARSEAFKYSKPMAAHGGTWDYATLDAFLEAPKKFLKGTRMSFRGLRKAQERANLIAYMRAQAAIPAPLE